MREPLLVVRLGRPMFNPGRQRDTDVVSMAVSIRSNVIVRNRMIDVIERQIYRYIVATPCRDVSTAAAVGINFICFASF